MYDELVKRLRRCAVYLPEKFSKNAETLDVLMKAADAIEEMSRLLDGVNADNDSLCSKNQELEGKLYLLKKTAEWLNEKISQWISVEERLPEDEKPVLAYYGFPGSKETGMYFRGTLSYYPHEERPHWQHESVGVIVTHWMPLPEPPKEE